MARIPNGAAAWSKVPLMAKGRKPQISLDDLERLASAAFGSPTQPTRGQPQRAMAQSVNSAAVKYLDARDFGKPNNMATDVYDYLLSYLNPIPFFTAEETRRLVDNKRPDKGHLATAALLAAFVKAPKIARGVRNATRFLGREGRELFEGTPRGSRTQPRRTASANMGGVANDPMALYAALVASQNRR